MAVIQHVGTQYGSGFETPATAVSLVSGTGAQGQQLVVFNYGFGVSETLTLSGPGMADWLRQDDLEGGQWLDARVTGQSGVLPLAGLQDLTEAWEAGNRSGTLMYLDDTPLPGLATTTLVAEVGNKVMVFSALQSGTGVTSFTLSGTALTGARDQTGGSEYIRNISDLGLVETGGNSYLYAASATQHGLTGYRVNANGSLQVIEEVGLQQSLPINRPSAVDVAVVDGQSFLIVASAGSSSVTVFAVGADGSLSVTDHIIDGLDTRFQGASQLEVVQLGAQSFIVVSGMDDGLSVLHLTAEGRLVHADSIADGNGMSLQAITGLATQTDANGFDIMAVSGNEAGLSHLRVTYDAGIVESGTGGTVNGTGAADMLSLTGTAGGQLQGGGGTDILSDGAGSDRLRGGAGADVFVFRADGQRDVIEDLDITQDRIDLSSWERLRSIDQLQIISTSWGAIIRYGNEELELRSVNGQSLDKDDLLQVLPEFLSHVTVELGALQTSTPEPVPDPPPPVPAPPPTPTPIETPEPTPSPGPAPGPTPGPTPSPPPAGVTLVGGSGADLLQGTDWDDVLAGGHGNDTLNGDDGNDMLAGSHGDDRIRGQGGNDNIGGGYGNDAINGGLGDDTIGAGPGEDTVNGSIGNDYLSGGPDHDTVYGEDGNDMLAGAYGNDKLFGGDGNDNMGGGPGHDLMRGGHGNDTMGSGPHNDTLDGGTGHDFLAAAAGHDRVDGGPGEDTINAGSGDDTITGGLGPDLFVFKDLNSGEYDKITDFTPGIDTIRLHGVSGTTQQSRYDSLQLSETSQGVTVEYAGHTILLEDVGLADISRADFLFI